MQKAYSKQPLYTYGYSKYSKTVQKQSKSIIWKIKPIWVHILLQSIFWYNSKSTKPVNRELWAPAEEAAYLH